MTAIHHQSSNQWQQNTHSTREWEVCEVDEQDEDIHQSSNNSTRLAMETADVEEEDIDDSSYMSSSPSIPDENINFDLVYALHTFVATVEGQASVVKGDALILMEDTNIYWWLVEVLKTREVGYIPAENIETPYERLARLNKHRNVEITSLSHENTRMDDGSRLSPSLPPLLPAKKLKSVTIASDEVTRVIHYEVESNTDTDADEDEHDNYQDNDVDDDDNDEFQDAQEITQGMDEGNENDDCDAITNAPDQSTSYHYSTAMARAADTMSEPLEPLRVFAGNIGQDTPLFHTFSIRLTTTADELVKEAMTRFALDQQKHPMATDRTLIEYYISVQGQDGDDYVLAPQDKPLSIFKTLAAPLTTPMPSVSHIKQSSPNPTSTTATITTPSSSRRRRSSSFSNYEKTSYDEDSIIRFYLHRRIKRAHEREGIFYIKVSLYPDDGTSNDTTTSTTVSPSGKQKMILPSRQEIDRIDKIMAVKLEQQIGSVIAMALEKFHVPDAEPDYPTNAQLLTQSHQMIGPTDRRLTKYCMSVRCTLSSSVEVPLDPRDHMATALHHQNKVTSPVVTSDLLFILRRADTPMHRRFQQQQHNSGSDSGNNSSSHCQSHPQPILEPINPNHHRNEKGHESAERRPSILDILMDSPRSADNRSPGLLNSHTTAFDDSRRPSFPSSLANQERKSSLTPSHHQGLLTSVTMAGVSSGDLVTPHSPSTGSLSPPTPGFRRTSVMSTSNISTTSSGFSDYCDTTTATTTITADMNHIASSGYQPSPSKKENSLRQQFKRLVGWSGSSSGSSKSKKNAPQPLLQQQQQLQIIAGTSAVSLVQQNNESTLSVKYWSVAASSSQVSFVSSPATPLTPTPQDDKDLLPKERSGASYSSKPSTPVTSNIPLSPIQGSPAPSSSQVLLPNESAVSSSASSLSSVDDKEPVDLSDDSDDDEDVEDVEGTQPMMPTGADRNKELPRKPSHQQDNAAAVAAAATDGATGGAVGEMNDIQAQYTRWMDIQGQDHTKRLSKADYTEAPLPPLPTTPISPASSTSPPSSLSIHSTPPHQQHTGVITNPSTATSSLQQQKQQQQQQQQPVPSSKEAGIDDLFFLVTRGVDYLQSRESSKWDDEGGYQFHPWNRPDGSFVIHKKPEAATPLHDIVYDTENSSGNEPEATVTISDDDVVMDAAAAAALADGSNSNSSSNSSSIGAMTATVSVPRVRSNSTSSNIQQQQKPGVVAPSSSKPASIRQSPPAAQNEACIDEEELQRIVAAHIVF